MSRIELYLSSGEDQRHGVACVGGNQLDVSVTSNAVAGAVLTSAGATMNGATPRPVLFGDHRP